MTGQFLGSMRHPNLLKLEHQIKEMFDEVDDWLEEKYGENYTLHPNRPIRGTAANKEMDGLFNVGADFSAGYGSQFGRGYVIRIQISTLEHIPLSVRRCIEQDVENLVRSKLPQAFSHRNFRVRRDGALMKITGHFDLGPAHIE